MCSCKLHVDHAINLMSITYAVSTSRKLQACWIISENNPLHHIHALRLHTTYMYTLFSPSKIQGMIWAGPTTALKLLKSNHSHIKEISILKVCWAKMLYVHWGEHWCEKEITLRKRKRRRKIWTKQTSIETNKM